MTATKDGVHTVCYSSLLSPSLTSDDDARKNSESPSRRTHLLAAISLSVIRITVTPVPVAALLPAVQLNKSPLLVVFGLIPLVRAIFV
jgi:hypothetical protein